MVNAKTGADLQSAADIDPKHFDWFLDEYERFARHKSLESAILASADMLEKGEYGSVEDKIKKAVEASYGVSVKKVRTMIYGAETRTRYTKRGIQNSKKGSYKKAIVKVAK